MFSKRKTDYTDIGLLMIRLSLGIMFIMHGFPKLMGGVATWTKVGGAVGMIGVNFGYPFWGFMASASEVVGGLLFAIGLFFREACFFLAITMLVAFYMHYALGDGFVKFSHALESFFVFASFVFIGPGSMSVQRK